MARWVVEAPQPLDLLHPQLSARNANTAAADLQVTFDNEDAPRVDSGAFVLSQSLVRKINQGLVIV